MYKNPIYHFDNTTETGINIIPNDTLILIKDVDNYPKQVIKIDNTGMTSSSTIQDFLDDTSLWKSVTKFIESEVINSNTTLIKDNIYLCDTKGVTLDKDQTAYTLTLPASPDDNDSIQLMDGYGNAQNRPILISRNGNNIDDTAEDLTLDVNYFDIKLVYSNTNSTWALGGK